MKKRKCPVCHTTLVGRIDKKFCCDQCRFIFNNRNKIESEKNIVTLNRVLRKNRTILKNLCPSGKGTVRKDVLESHGYDFNAFTSIFVTSSKAIYYLCYDYGFTPLDEKGIRKALIIIRQDYMNEWDPWRYVKGKDVVAASS